MVACLSSSCLLFVCLIVISIECVRAMTPKELAKVKTFGTGRASIQLGYKEKVLLDHNLSGTGSWGVLTHFWVAGDPSLDGAIFNYFIDGESTPSISFQPYMICGRGYDDQTPWGHKWFGKGAGVGGGWFHHFRIPFQSRVFVTACLPRDSLTSKEPNRTVSMWVQIRGTENLPIRIGDLTLPPTSRAVLQKLDQVEYKPLEVITFANITSGAGLFFYHSIAVNSSSMSYLEGCYHAYTPYADSFPGLLLSTGTEDYFNSAWYFNDGLYNFPDSGLSHFIPWPAPGLAMAAYRLHEYDPVLFTGGFRLTSRSGDVLDKNGEKCTVMKGPPVGSPQASVVNAYTLLYVWGDEVTVGEVPGERGRGILEFEQGRDQQEQRQEQVVVQKFPSKLNRVDQA